MIKINYIIFIMSRHIPKPLREAVWRKNHGKNLEGKCWVCQQNTITAFNFECGHIISKKRGGDISLKNLMAICSPCNKSMGETNMIKFKNIIWKDRNYNYHIIKNKINCYIL